MKNVKTKWRLEYWECGRKYVRTFGSKEQANRFVSGLALHASGVDIRQYQETGWTETRKIILGTPVFPSE